MSRGLLLVAFASGLFGCGHLDRRAPYGSPAYLEARERVEAARAQFHLETGPYLAGWSKVAIEVPPSAPIAGYRRPERAHDGQPEPVFVRAFAIATEGSAPALYFVADLLATERHLTETVRDRLVDLLPRERIRFSATHTHSGPGGFVPSFPFDITTGDFDESAFNALVTAHERAGREALAKVRPSRIGAAEARAPGVCQNRVEPGAPVDDELTVLYFEQLDGGARAALVTQGCHPVVLGADNHRISADFPGTLAALFEGSRLEVLGLAAGGVGNGQPARLSRSAMAEGLAGPLGEALDIAAARALPHGRLGAGQVELPVPRLSAQLFEGWTLWSPLVRAVLAPRFSLELTVVGETALLGLPVELAGRLTRIWRKHAAQAGLRLAIVSFGGDYLGYVNPRSSFEIPPDRRGPGYDNEMRTLSFLGPGGAEFVLSLGDLYLEAARLR